MNKLMIVFPLLVAACSKPPELDEHYYKLLVEEELPLGVNRVRIGDQEFRAYVSNNDDARSVGFLVPASLRLSDGAPITIVASGPCGGRTRTARVSLTADEEQRLRAERDVTLPATLEGAPTWGDDLRIYVDRTDAPDAVVAIGSSTLGRMPVGDPNRIHGADDCPGGRQVFVDGAPVGELFTTCKKNEPCPPTTYLVSARPGRCYDEIDVGYGSATGGVVDELRGGAHVYRLHGFVDDFLIPPPSSVEVGGIEALPGQPGRGAVRRAVTAVPCEE